MKDSFKEVGEQRIVVMAALAIADEAEDARNKVETTTRELLTLKSELDAARGAIAAMEAKVTSAVEDAAPAARKSRLRPSEARPEERFSVSDAYGAMRFPAAGRAFAQPKCAPCR